MDSNCCSSGCTWDFSSVLSKRKWKENRATIKWRLRSCVSTVAAVSLMQMSAEISGNPDAGVWESRHSYTNSFFFQFFFPLFLLFQLNTSLGLTALCGLRPGWSHGCSCVYVRVCVCIPSHSRKCAAKVWKKSSWHIWERKLQWKHGIFF